MILNHWAGTALLKQFPSKYSVNDIDRLGDGLRYNQIFFLFHIVLELLKINMKKIFFITFILITIKNVKSQETVQTNPSNTLRNEILKMDSLLFNVGFNQCDSIVYKNILSDDLEFYDDRSGLNASKQIDVQSLIEKCAGKDNLTRVLSNCTVDKLGDFGALQIGEHYFVVNGVKVGTANFIHVWQRTNQGWKLKRVISYEHKSTHL
jgi:hypothetical protein